MADLQFENQTNEFGRPPEASSGFDITGKLIEWGFVSSRKESEYVLIAVAVLALVVAYFLYGSLSGGSDVPTTPVYSTDQTI